MAQICIHMFDVSKHVSIYKMPELHSRLTVPLSPAVINVILLYSLFKEGFLDSQEAHTGSIKQASGANVAVSQDSASLKPKQQHNIDLEQHVHVHVSVCVCVSVCVSCKRCMRDSVSDTDTHTGEAL